MIYFTSDLHFGHANVIKYCARPFKDLEDMEKGLIAKWNAKVSPDDTVYVLGDVFFCNKEKAKAILDQLHGIKILVKGNHDRKPQAMLDIGFKEVHEKLELDIGGQKVKLSHFPYRLNIPETIVNKIRQLQNECRTKGIDSASVMDEAVLGYQQQGLITLEQAEKLIKYDLRFFGRRYDDDGGWLLCGHVHEKWAQLDRMINVGVDVRNFEPISIEDVVLLINS